MKTDRWACIMLGRRADGVVNWRIERSYGVEEYAHQLAAQWNAMGHEHLAWIVVPYEWTTDAMAQVAA